MNVLNILKKFAFPALGVLFGILLIIFGIVSSGKDDKKTKNESNLEPEELIIYSENLEKRISSLIGHISGVSDVEVLLTVENTSETVYATTGQNRDYVIIKDESGNESPVQVKEITAGIRGIAIVCDYGGNEATKKEIIDMISSLFGIGSNRVSVVSAG